MNISVTLDQNGVFFAGEKFSCTISFTNSHTSPSHFNSAPSSPRARVNRPSSSQLSRRDITSLINGFANHSRSSSEPPRDFIRQTPKSNQRNGKDATIVSKTNSSVLNSLEQSLSSTSGLRNLIRRSASLTSIASSTLSFLSGSEQMASGSLQINEPIDATPYSLNVDDIESTPDLTEESLQGRKTDLSETFSLDMDIEDTTPRASLDLYAIKQHDLSTEWNSSDRVNRRLSLVSQFNSSPSLAHKSETILWSFAQIEGHFFVDQNLVKISDFEPVKSKVMYKPAHRSGGHGGGSLISSSSGTSFYSSGTRSRDEEKSVPVFSTPPSIIFTSLHLAPGETRTFKYETFLPSDLPPSHKGKAFRFNYNLIVGIQNGGLNNQSQVLELPFRVFNHTSEDGSRPVYDLMNPIVVWQDEATVFCIEDIPVKLKQKYNVSKQEFMNYVQRLQHSDDLSTLTPGGTELTRRESGAYTKNFADNSNCLRIVNYLSKSTKGATFEICKGNDRVAELILPKTAYRLGEVVSGVIVLTQHAIPTYQVSVSLETTERIEQSITNRSSSQIARATRQVYAEHNEFCLSTRRASFNLCIPPSGTPEFFTTGVRLQWYLGIEFVTSAALTPFVRTNTDDRHKHFQAMQETYVETLDCLIPIKVYPTDYELARMYNASHRFILS
ncbi:uncharacterized protein VTP21DRAFT_3056 [Calcarisporiella thermophila]|uniref:uncharacterized protein n=1 Tax=Calcarisporiella thermophila TaxID=911321 RepID=UPI0037449B79